jgi:hypothetical protein
VLNARARFRGQGGLQIHVAQFSKATHRHDDSGPDYSMIDYCYSKAHCYGSHAYVILDVLATNPNMEFLNEEEVFRHYYALGEDGKWVRIFVRCEIALPVSQNSTFNI